VERVVFIKQRATGSVYKWTI